MPNVTLPQTHFIRHSPPLYRAGYYFESGPSLCPRSGLVRGIGIESLIGTRNKQVRNCGNLWGGMEETFTQWPSHLGNGKSERNYLVSDPCNWLLQTIDKTINKLMKP